MLFLKCNEYKLHFKSGYDFNSLVFLCVWVVSLFPHVVETIFFLKKIKYVFRHMPHPPLFNIEAGGKGTKLEQDLSTTLT